MLSDLDTDLPLIEKPYRQTDLAAKLRDVLQETPAEALQPRERTSFGSA